MTRSISSSSSSGTNSILQQPPPVFRQRRVVVTGLGVVSPLGCTVDRFWNALLRSECGVKSYKFNRADKFDPSVIPCQVAAPVSEDFDISKYTKEHRRMAKFIQFAVAASSDALADAKWFPKTKHESERTGVAIGTGIGSLEDINETYSLLREGSYRKVSAYFLPRMLLNMASGNVSLMHKLQGPNHTAVTACATGAHAIGDAFRMIQRGDADVMVAGGTEACLNEIAFAGFSRIRALSTSFNDSPQEASRPFDAKRDGFVMGEGAAAVVLEDYEHALQRGANIYAEIRGYGLSGDAHHITAPAEDGDGALRAMQSAVRQSGIPLHHIDYINAHATSTPLGDRVEYAAIKRLFLSGQECSEEVHLPRVSSIKGAVGHLLGASGAIEAVATILSVKHDVVPPTLNLHEPSADLEERAADTTTDTTNNANNKNSSSSSSKHKLNLVPLKAQQCQVTAAISNSFGFGGTNASILFAKPPPPPPPA